AGGQQPFYAMRFVGKRTLSDAIEEHHERMGAGDPCHLRLHRLLGDFVQICQTIAYAHSRGVIHRDLKPENIALDSFGQVIVLDWGLAKILDTAELGTQRLLTDELDDSVLSQTLAGEVIGTPLYMSPEQAAGRLDDINERTDVYGLGAILFSILTGSAPHERTARNSDSSARIRNVLDAIATGQTPNPRELCAGIPKALERICTKAMANRPYTRFESAAELATEVENWRAGQANRSSQYETLRMEGRELKNDFQAVVDDLESNVRFASLLPPIQELIQPTDESEDAVWRERLATIYAGLLRAKPAFSRIAYCRVDGDQFTEIVRVERHSRDRGTTRKVPRSRLRVQKINDFIQMALSLQPEEAATSLVCDPLCDGDNRCNEAQLVAAVPVFDERTEEPFGVVMITCDLSDIFARQLGRTRVAAEIVAACNAAKVLVHVNDGRTVADSGGKAVAGVASHFDEAAIWLQDHSEFIDESDMAIYGARLWLAEQGEGLMYLLRARDTSAT
ncbi:serine/threonine protein kinase, partial [bacterium]|nr:serine/threonine protein kinase [bacterium]